MSHRNYSVCFRPGWFWGQKLTVLLKQTSRNNNNNLHTNSGSEMFHSLWHVFETVPWKRTQNSVMLILSFSSLCYITITTIDIYTHILYTYVYIRISICTYLHMYMSYTHGMYMYILYIYVCILYIYLWLQLCFSELSLLPL